MRKKFSFNKKFFAVLAVFVLLGTRFTGNNNPVGGSAAAPDEINHEESTYFAAPNFYKMTSDDGLVILPKYPTYQQTNEYTCGPAAALTVLRYYNVTAYDEMKLAQEMQTQAYPAGTTPANLANFFERIGWNVQSNLTLGRFRTYEDFQDFVTENLAQGRPIMVENVERGGHWRVIIGYDSMETDSDLDDVLIFADSYDTSDHNQDGYAIGNGRRFFSTWFDASMFPEDQRTQPYVVAYPR